MDLLSVNQQDKPSGELEEREQRIERAMRHAWYETALEYHAIREHRLYRTNGTGKRGWETWADYCQERWGRQCSGIDLQIARAIETREMTKLLGISTEQLPANMSHATELARLPSPQTRAEVWQRVVGSGTPITAKVVEGEVDRKLAELKKDWYTLDDWLRSSAADRQRILSQTYNSDATFNETNDNIEWAAYSWNPVTGCQHACPYCYAQDIAHRFYPQGFTPSFVPSRLVAPVNTKRRATADENIGQRNVFVCSMADLFGDWVPQEWIDAVLATVRQAPQWGFIFLTKNPKRLATIDWPENARVGTTVDVQARVRSAQESFRHVNASVRFLSCEPLMERLTFDSLEMFDWVIVGGRSRNSQLPEYQPQWEWLRHLENQASNAGCEFYLKPNLNLMAIRPRGYPAGM